MQADLVVHKQKVLELERALRHVLSLPPVDVAAPTPSWPRRSLTLNASSHRSPVLITTGPSGCGKASCLAVLAEELGVELVEWKESASFKARDTPTAGASCFLCAFCFRDSTPCY